MGITKGVNSGFVETAPTSNPGATSRYQIDTESRATKETAPTGATTVTEIGWWCDNATEEANFEVGIYTHNSGDNNPEAVVGSLSQTNAKGTGSGWKVVSGLNIPITAGTIYWIAVQLDDTATATETDRAFDGGEKMDVKTSQTTLPEPWGITDNTNTQMLSLYAKVTIVEEATDNMTIIGENIY